MTDGNVTSNRLALEAKNDGRLPKTLKCVAFLISVIVIDVAPCCLGFLVSIGYGQTTLWILPAWYYWPACTLCRMHGVWPLFTGKCDVSGVGFCFLFRIMEVVSVDLTWLHDSIMIVVCFQCFSCGVESGPHKKDHQYRVGVSVHFGSPDFTTTPI
jgi:hypothetical protein